MESTPHHVYNTINSRLTSTLDDFTAGTDWLYTCKQTDFPENNFR